MNSITVGNTRVTPSKIVCIGRNYVAHIEELGSEIPEEMVVFLKPNSAISHTLVSTHASEVLHYEGEIALMVQAGQVAAVGFGLDLTKRGLQSRLKEKGLPWERAKAFDGALVMSDFAPLEGDPRGLSLELLVNDELRQAGGVKLMMYQPSTILRELDKFMRLEDGDIIMTGTPAGVGAVAPGERFHGRVLQHGEVLAEGEWQAQ